MWTTIVHARSLQAIHRGLDVDAKRQKGPPKPLESMLAFCNGGLACFHGGARRIPHLPNACSPAPRKVDETQGDMETHKTCQVLDRRRINRDESYPLRMFLPARMTSSTSKS